MRTLIALPLLLLSFFAAAVAENQAFQLLDNLSKSLRQLNFSTSFVVIKNNNAEPYHWTHGIADNGDELEILSLLNGAHRDVVRRNSTVSYIESGGAPFSVNSQRIASPIPDVLSGSVEELMANYDLVSVGKSRVLGRAAQSVRIVSKDPYRYGHKLWLDEESGLLLKLAIVNSSGQILEQIQFMHLEVEEQISASLRQIEHADFSNVLEKPSYVKGQSQNWQVTWLPKGFKEISSNSHRILHTNQPSEFKLFSDGLVDVSVYVSSIESINAKTRPPGFAQDGATLVYNQVFKGFEVSVVGKVPPATAQSIANSIAFEVVQ